MTDLHSFKCFLEERDIDHTVTEVPEPLDEVKYRLRFGGNYVVYFDQEERMVDLSD